MITLLENRDEARANASIPETGWRLWPFPRDHCCCSVGRVLVPDRQREPFNLTSPRPPSSVPSEEHSPLQPLRARRRTHRRARPRHRLPSTAAATASRGARRAQARPRRPPPRPPFTAPRLALPSRPPRACDIPSAPPRPLVVTPALAHRRVCTASRPGSARSPRRAWSPFDEFVGPAAHS